MHLELVDIEDPANRAGSVPAPDDDVTLAPALASGDDLTIDIKPVERAVPITQGSPVKIDSYAQQAAREYARGHVDQPLWDRALTQASGDKTAAAAIYVRARGTALRLLDRDRRGGVPPPPPAPAAEAAVPDRRRVARRAAFARYRTPALGGLGLLIVAAASIYYLAAGDAPTTPVVDAARSAPAVAPSVTPAVAGGATVALHAAPRGDAAASSQAKADAANSLAALRAKIEALRLAGNWNVLVLHAVEWTRREPNSPAAWDELRAGYVHLRQYDDALAAARRAVALAPDDPALWRHVGEVNVALDDPPAALTAFREAIARDGGDVASLQAVALLATRLGQPQEAKAALDRALVAQPGDAVTVCLRQGLAQIAPTRDAHAALRQVSAVDGKCRGQGDTSAVALK